ncbi:PKD domain-containing protein [Flavisolibacter ginsenosidimutans]|uniref:PKD domain-containing protein n=1 Tax=Flavisolibacter ginsenosidimutans TaxID=661481 RepID=UPI00155AD9C8|nr:PKD domain-containing protein [Flavisolibacter ginsenosidimutans]
MIVCAQTPAASFTAVPASGCSPLVVNFSDASTGNPTTWFWDFGNGATSTLKNPSTTYFIPGKYTVKLTVTNSSGSDTKTQTDFVTVYGKPTVLFGASDSIGCFPFPVRFADLSLASTGTANTSWIWDFGDGAQSSVQNPQNKYGSSGNYTVSLKVTNDKGCFATFTKPAYIRLNGGVKPDFTFLQPSACRTPVTIGFTNLSTGPNTLTYQWNFGDGTTSAQQNPLHTYTSPGAYSVYLVTTSSSGCTDTLTKPNLFNLGNITTSFTAPDSVCVGEAVAITNTSSAPAISTLWDFGDGATATSVSGTKTYTVPGTYTIRLLQSYGACTDSASKSIKVRPIPKASFIADKTAFCQAPATVNFTDASQNAVSYEWNFGDGATSSQQNPSHTYTAFGNYTVKLKTTNALGCADSSTLTVTISKPVITLSGLPQEGCVPYTANFVASVSSPDPVVTYAWDFGDGASSSAAAPSHTYTAQGTYTVTLKVTTQSGCTESYSYAAAVKAGTKPQVNFTATPREVCAFQTVSFSSLTTGLSTGSNVSYLWNFGDGGTSTAQNPTYQYNDTGTFNVVLYVKNNGCEDSLRIDRFIKIKPPIANFIYQTSCANKLHFGFIDRSIGATSWQWDFGDGVTSTQQSPTHDYAAYGTYIVKLLVSNDTCTHTKALTIRIVNGTPDFHALPTTACKGATISFAADTMNAANIARYDWNFGHGGSRGLGINGSTVYPRAGLYSVSLTITDVMGCVDSVVKPQYIRITGPTANFIAANNNGCRGLTATFTDSSKSDGISNLVRWQWNFGDGTTANDATGRLLQHSYLLAGSFPVSLKVTDAGGCVDSINRPALVNASNIKADFVSEDTLSCPGAAIHFTNNSAASSAYTSTWQFGNGDTSLQKDPVASYNADGVYSIRLKIKDAFGCNDSLTKPHYITVKHPVAGYTVSDSASSCTPFMVHFTNTSTFYTSYIWDLGGGTSVFTNPTQYYNQPGTYKTKLIVTSPGGCRDTATKDITVIDVSGARLWYLPLNGCKPLTVDVHAVAPKNMDYVWDFGDGTIISSQDTATRHVYNFFGDFVPKIILSDKSGCVIPVTGPDTIRIKGATAKFGVDRRLLCDSGLVRFLDSTTFNNPIVAYNWNFGDGTSSTQSTVTHYYNKPGIYPVSVDVLTQSLCVDTFRLSVPVRVVASPDVRIDGDSVICIGEGMNHLGAFNRTDTSLVRWAWNFPNGNTSVVQLPQKQIYNSAGKFLVQAIATNSDGCKDTAVKNIRVNPLPSVQLPSVLTTRTGNPVTLPAVYSGGVVDYKWTHVESLNCGTCPQPVASPKFNTKYTVDFVDNNGCKNKGEIQVIVFCNNDNVFVPNTFSPNGDGSNDVFYVRGKGLNRVKSLRIFNRWGQVVFERMNFAVNDASAGWDGTFNGAKQKPDVYIYQLEIWCDNSTVVSFEGNVALIQ